MSLVKDYLGPADSGHWFADARWLDALLRFESALAQAQARKLAAKPLSALIETKRLMKAGQSGLVRERMAEEGASFGKLMGGPAAKEAFTAFMEKRKPDFSQC